MPDPTPLTEEERAAMRHAWRSDQREMTPYEEFERSFLAAKAFYSEREPEYGRCVRCNRPDERGEFVELIGHPTPNDPDGGTGDPICPTCIAHSERERVLREAATELLNEREDRGVTSRALDNLHAALGLDPAPSTTEGDEQAEVDDCAICGAPAGYPPAGPCDREHKLPPRTQPTTEGAREGERPSGLASARDAAERGIRAATSDRDARDAARAKAMHEAEVYPIDGPTWNLAWQAARAPEQLLDEAREGAAKAATESLEQLLTEGHGWGDPRIMGPVAADAVLDALAAASPNPIDGRSTAEMTAEADAEDNAAYERHQARRDGEPS
jgi:hypothetical protein